MIHINFCNINLSNQYGAVFVND